MVVRLFASLLMLVRYANGAKSILDSFTYSQLKLLNCLLWYLLFVCVLNRKFKISRD